MSTGYYILVSSSDPNYSQIVSDCDKENAKYVDPTSHVLSVTALRGGLSLIKIKSGSAVWLSRMPWRSSVIDTYRSDEDNKRVDFYQLNKMIES